MRDKRNRKLAIGALTIVSFILTTGCMQHAHDLGTNPNRTGANVSNVTNQTGNHTLNVGGHGNNNPAETDQYNLLSAQSIAAQLRMLPGINQAYVLYDKGRGIAYVALDVQHYNYTNALKTKVVNKVKQLDPNLRQVLTTADNNAVHAFREYAANINHGHPTSKLWNQLHNVDEVINRIWATKK